MIQMIVGLVLCTVQAILLVPLLRHAARYRAVDGVSVSGEAAWTVAGLGWVAYGLTWPAPILVVSGLLAAAGSGTYVLLLRRHCSRFDASAAVAVGAVTAAGLVAGWVVGGVLGLAVALGLFGIVQFIPQAVVVVRGWGRPQEGVNAAAAGLRAVYTGAWALYAGAWALLGLARADWPLIAWGVSGAVVFAAQAFNAGARRPATSVPDSAVVETVS